jgi:hypothetical protein
LEEQEQEEQEEQNVRLILALSICLFSVILGSDGQRFFYRVFWPRSQQKNWEDGTTNKDEWKKWEL